MASLLFNWNQEAPEGLEYRLYEDDVLIVDHIGALTFTLDMKGKPDATYEYHVTSVRVSDGVESGPSPATAINFINPPQAPTGLTVSLVK